MPLKYNSVSEKLSVSKQSLKVGIIGGGVAGSTIALRLAELGIDTTLIEKGPSLVNGPPICHLHAGGNLYREIPEEHCIRLLKQSIDTLKVYPASANIRPTVVAVPISDKGRPDDLLERLKSLQNHYQHLIDIDASNQVLGEPECYFELFDKKRMQALADGAAPASTPRNNEEWMIPVAKQIDLDSVQYPLIMVQEYGLSAFRFASIVSLASDRLPHCKVLTNSRVVSLKQSDHQHWQVEVISNNNTGSEPLTFDYLINACGFRSGEIDDMLGTPRERMVEFKAAYVTLWPDAHPYWPEVVFYGDRGTPQGMAQLTPYPEGYFQLHGMTEDITLFKNGLVSSDQHSAQPKLDPLFIRKIDKHWPEHSAKQRSISAIKHLARFVPAFSTAIPAAKPLFGAQQIPGTDPDLRAADVSFFGGHYARTEIVKASSALAASDAILKHLAQQALLPASIATEQINTHYFPVTHQLSETDINQKAIDIAKARGYPGALAKQI
jgi:glycine/D-amino acid oxidase-like deaminating enzyme